MIGYISRRVLLALFTTWIITILAFVIIELPPGDNVTHFLDRQMQLGSAMDLHLAAEVRKYFGLDKPQYQRYAIWVWRMVRYGDLGLAITQPNEQYLAPRPVKELISNRIWTTVVLTGFTVLVTWTFAIPVGIYSAVRHHSVGDYAFTFLGFTGLAVPDFLLGLVLMYIGLAYFEKSVGGLFSAGYQDAPLSWGKLLDLLDHLWIPAIVLGTSGTASLIRIMRNNLLDELGKPYVVTARAKGMHPIRAIVKYPVRVAINPLVSTVGYLLPALVGGSVIVSVVLGLPTLGPVFLYALTDEDVHTAGFIVLLLGMLTVAGTLISDILLAVVDPRIKYSRE
jgi:peptide/nickel transport system permease protein